MSVLGLIGTAGPYPLYVLFLLLLAYLLNQLDRYMLAICTMPMAQEIHYGDIVCMNNHSYPKEHLIEGKCSDVKNETYCQSAESANGTNICTWDYNGQGLEYQLIAGPVFIVIYTLIGIFLGFAADFYNRKNLLAICLFLWSGMTLLTGFVTEYWQLVLLRFGLGIGEAGCTPFAASLIGEYFVAELRGAAFGVYNFGIYTGYSLSYALGNFITLADINGQGWRWAFYISSIPGLVLPFIIFFTVKEPDRKDAQLPSSSSVSLMEKLRIITKPFLNPTLVIFILGGSIRNAGGYVWAYNTQPFFVSTGQTPEQIGTWMSWIPLVAGCLGAFLGGFVSDRFVKKRGPAARVLLLVVSQFLAAPFAAGALFLPPPWGYISLIPSNIIGEMWVGVALAVVVELVPSTVRTGAVAFYLFVITNIGGNIPLLVPPLQTSFENLGLDKTDSLRYALLILFPGLYVLGAVLFLLSVVSLRRDLRLVRSQDYVPLEGTDNED